MDAFEQQLVDRLPLAAAALKAFEFAFDSAFLRTLYDEHRGRCYTDVLCFSRLVSLVRDCLLQHGGSGHRGCVEAERDGSLNVDESSVYRKLANMPVAVSRALLSQCTARLGELMADTPAAAVADLLPGCFEALEPVVLDGKKIKNAAGRLKPTRGYKGALLGAKALVALSLRRGLVLAMSDSLDGLTNDVPLVPELLPQVRDRVKGPILWLADRQFGGLGIPPQMTARAGDHFLLRVSRSATFTLIQTLGAYVDAEGRTVTDELGTYGKGKNALSVRRVTLHRGAQEGGDDVVLITDLTDPKAYPAADLLKLYRRRWGIERVFQEVTETFSLEHLIGCSPKAVLFQFAFCLLMYNLTQVLKRYVAADGKVEVATVSTHGLFYDLRRELTAWSYLGLTAAPAASADTIDASVLRQRLAELLAGSWDPLAYTKASDKKPRPQPPPRQLLRGGHASVQQLLEGRIKLKIAKS